MKFIPLNENNLNIIYVSLLAPEYQIPSKQKSEFTTNLEH